MKILVFGAGVLGCNLARNLFRAGKDVTLLARGKWAEEIRENGLRIKDKFSPRVSVSRVPVVTELKPEDSYDVVFAVLRYTQLDSILDTLRESRAKNLVFVGNNVRARALSEALPDKNVLFALRFRRDTASGIRSARSTSRRSPSARFRAQAPTSRSSGKFLTAQSTRWSTSPIWRTICSATRRS